jgi:polyisoprenyl-phosphate glycosyltransferase
LFSIVVPVYQNEANLSDTVPKLLSLQSKLPQYKIELIFVDDGSTDRSFEILHTYYMQNKDIIKVIKFTKNYGQFPAIYAGMKIAQGDCIGIISADLQDPYELFVGMINKWKAGKKLVIAERKERQESIKKTFLSNLYWKLVNLYAVKGFPVGGFDFCLIDRCIMRDINALNEKNSHIFVLIFSLGYPYEIIYYTRQTRTTGKSQYSLSKKIKMFVDTFVAFSYLPIRAISFIGLVISIISFIYALAIILNRIIFGNIYTGWTTIVVLISSLGGLILLSLGIIGEYLWRLLEETRKRPLYVIDSILNHNKE